MALKQKNVNDFDLPQNILNETKSADNCRDL